MALGGGIAIFLTVFVPLIALACGAGTRLDRVLVPDLVVHVSGIAARAGMVAWLCAAGGVLFITGLWDDRRAMGPWRKLLLQFIAAFLAAGMGGIRLSVFGAPPVIAVILSMFWMVVLINAFNFLDNMDGLSAGIALIGSLVMFALAWSNAQWFVCGLLTLTAGALSGFLWFNVHPARIFMGDAGSMVVGLLMAVCSIVITYFDYSPTGPTPAAIFTPLVVLAIPLYDFFVVVVLRLCQGRSPFVGDRQHFSHRLLDRGLSVPAAVGTIYLATACTGISALFLGRLGTGFSILIFAQTLMILALIGILESTRSAKS